MATQPGQSAILSGGYSPWQAPLAALFSGISAAGQPGGWSNFGMGVQQGAQNFQQGQQNQQMMDLRRMQIEQAEAETRRANQEREQEQARQASIRQSLARFTGSPTSVQPVGNYGAATGGVQTASGPAPIAAMFGGDPQKAALFTEYADAYPEQAYQMLVERGFAEPEKVEASSGVGKIMEDFNNGLIDGPTRDALLKKETYIAPQGGGADDGAWERYVDPQTGRSGQRNRRTGKIDWDPGNTMMTQVGVDANGNPIFDLVSGSPGPSKEYEAKMANQVTLMEDGINGLEKLVAEGSVSPARAAIGEGVSQLGPLGDVLSETLILGPKEKQYAAQRASALESLANTITGAAFTEQQKQNFIAMLPKPTDDDETFKEKLATMRNYMSQLKKNAKMAEPDVDGWEDVDGVQIRAKP
jgi:hypothetical protein